MIEIRELHKTFKKNHVLKGINLKLESPGIYALLGPNGSGKTTLIKALLGMVIPKEGEVLVNGAHVNKGYTYRQELNYMPQIANFPANIRVIELIRMIIDVRSQEAEYKELIQRFGLEPYLDQKLAHLSGGSAQKVNLVLTFMFDSPLYILDEPTTGLDPKALIHFKDLLEQEKNKGKTILITSHIMPFVEEVADEIIYILEGVIGFKGSIPELLAAYDSKDVEHAIVKLADTMQDA